MKRSEKVNALSEFIKGEESKGGTPDFFKPKKKEHEQDGCGCSCEACKGCEHQGESEPDGDED